jgi:hypothetical protein
LQACWAGAAAICPEASGNACHRPRAGDATAAAPAGRANRRHQPSIIKDIGRAIGYLRSLKQMAISWSSNISISLKNSETAFRSWIAARSYTLPNETDLDEAALKRAISL